MIRMEDVRKRFGSAEALRGVTLAVPSGAVFALVGPNGAGKSTAIKICMNLERASGGCARRQWPGGEHAGHRCWTLFRGGWRRARVSWT